jgi:hypothetical protein
MVSPGFTASSPWVAQAAVIASGAIEALEAESMDIRDNNQLQRAPAGATLLAVRGTRLAGVRGLAPAFQFITPTAQPR